MGEPAGVRVLRGDVVHGPLTREQVADLFARGRLAGADLASVGDGPWVRVADYLGEAASPPADHRPAPPQPPAPGSPVAAPRRGPRVSGKAVAAATLAVLVLVAAAAWFRNDSPPGGGVPGRDGVRDWGGGRGSHVATEDACVYTYEVGDLDRKTDLGTNLFLQQFTGPLAGSGRNPDPHPQESADSRAVVVQKNSSLTVLKTEVRVSDGDRPTAYQVHFVRVRDGKYRGKEGWITDKYLRPNR